MNMILRNDNLENLKNEVVDKIKIELASDALLNNQILLITKRKRLIMNAAEIGWQVW